MKLPREVFPPLERSSRGRKDVQSRDSAPSEENKGMN